MRIRKKLPVAVKGYPNFNVGDIADVPPGEAMALVGIGAAELVDENQAQGGFTTGRGIIQNPDPVVETRDPEPAKPAPKKRPV